MTKKTMCFGAGFTVFLVIVATAMGAFDLMVQKWIALACLVVALGLPFLPKSKEVFKRYTTPLFWAVLGYVIWNGISMFYADVPKAALFEFTKLIGAFAIFMAVLYFTAPTKKGVTFTANLFSIATAFFGIVSIDAASNGPIATAFKAFMGNFTNSMESFGYFENGIRMTGIFGNANTFAGLMALGVLLSLATTLNSSSKKERSVSLALLAINSLSYILLFSLGSLFMFMLACILMVALTKKGEKLSTFVLMFETAIITLIFTAVALISMGTSPMLPLAAIALNAVVLWAFDTYAIQTLVSKLTVTSKGGLIVGFAVTALLIAYIIAALNVTGALSLAPAETVMRGEYLKAGEYTLAYEGTTAGEASTEPTVRIISQNMTDLKVHTSSQLYSGAITAATFTVPEDSEIVKLYFTGSPEGNVLASVTCVNAANAADTADIKLDYKLLPSIAANRIQDLRANENSVQRIVFFQDGMKLFKQSPIIGQGLSGYEVGVASVQNFYYATRYVHNHYIQALCDLGIIGFALFMSILALCVAPLAALFKKCKKENHSNHGAFALPVMAACMIQLFGQAITDLTWSAGPFLVIAFGILALLIIITSRNFSDEGEAVIGFHSQGSYDNGHSDDFNNAGGKNMITGAVVSRALVIVVALSMTVLLTLNLYAYYKASSGNCTMVQMAQLPKLDKFEGDDYKISYIVSASTNGLTENYEQANTFATELMDNSDAVMNYLLPYYFNTAQDEKLFETASTAIAQGKASPDSWNNIFDTFSSAINTDRNNPVPILSHLFGNKEYYIDGLLGYYRDLQTRNETYLDDAMLTPSNVVFIGKLLGIENLDMSHLIQALDVFNKTAFDSSFAVDADKNGIPDNIAVLSGSTAWGQIPAASTKEGKSKKVTGSGFDGTMKAEAGTTIELEVFCVRGDDYTLRFTGLSGLNGTALPIDLTATIDGQAVDVQYDADGAFITAWLRGAVEADEATGVVASSGSTEKFVITFPTGGFASKVSVMR